MATYKGIKGVKVVTKTADPTASEAAGTVWYNSTGNALKYSIQSPTGAWASVDNLNTARDQSAGVGTVTACLAAGGNPGTPGMIIVETYDGSTWTETADLNTYRRNGKGSGTTTAAMVVGGWHSAGVTATEYYDGTSWTSQTGTLTRGGGYQSFGVAGASQASALIFGGEPGTTYWKYTEEWDGTSWSEQNNLLNGRQAPGGVGIVTAALCIGGYSPGVVNYVEQYDGTSWSATAKDLNSARGQLGASGTSTAALAYGGSGPSALTESFNGSTWTEVADLGTARYDPGNAQAPGNINTSALCIGGHNGSTAVNNVEEWAEPSYTIKTVTVS